MHKEDDEKDSHVAGEQCLCIAKEFQGFPRLRKPRGKEGFFPWAAEKVASY